MPDPAHPTPSGPPEPLRPFAALADPLAPEIASLDALNARLIRHRDAGRILPNTIESLRVEMTYHSNAIEGNTLSLRETQLVIEGQAPPGGKPLRELYEARNHDRAVRLVERWVAERSEEDPITERDLLDVHALVLADIDARAAGRFRSERVLIAGSRHVPPGSHRFGELVPAALDLANSPGFHPALQAAELHYNTAAIHPFADGNGRTARLLMNYLLLRRNLPVAIIDISERAEYLAALDEANASRCEPFARLIVRAVARTAERLLGPGAS